MHSGASKLLKIIDEKHNKSTDTIVGDNEFYNHHITRNYEPVE